MASGHPNNRSLETSLELRILNIQFRPTTRDRSWPGLALVFPEYRDEAFDFNANEPIFRAWTADCAGIQLIEDFVAYCFDWRGRFVRPAWRASRQH
jgi:hypothetical protein